MLAVLEHVPLLLQASYGHTVHNVVRTARKLEAPAHALRGPAQAAAGELGLGGLPEEGPLEDAEEGLDDPAGAALCALCDDLLPPPPSPGRCATSAARLGSTSAHTSAAADAALADIAPAATAAEGSPGPTPPAALLCASCRRTLSECRVSGAPLEAAARHPHASSGARVFRGSSEHHAGALPPGTGAVLPTLTLAALMHDPERAERGRMSRDEMRRALEGYLLDDTD